MNAAIKGFKGGSAPATGSVEAPDSLHSVAHAYIQDLVSEGPIRGFKHGAAEFLKDVYFNGTPVQNEDGSLNFKNIKIDSRSGTQSQTYMQGFPDVENESAVGLELTSTIPWVQTFEDTQISAVRVRLSVPAIEKSNSVNGNIDGYSIAYKIELQTDSGAFVLKINTAITGKDSGKYEKSHKIELPPATSGWVLRVTRLTPNQHITTIADTLTVESYTEIVDGKFRYPNSAYVGSILDASQFNSIPTRAFDLYGLIVQVPSNYDPITRVYTGVWDGSFKPAWTNNPAWIFYAISTNDRWGLGRYFIPATVNKFYLYTISQYCDQLVPDGFGGLEPRFTCTTYLQSSNDAFKVMQDFASIFRGFAYWSGGTVSAIADMPGDAVYTYTKANVVDGKFTYSGSDLQTRFTVALVSWNNPANQSRAEIHYVDDPNAIARYGVRPTSVIAMGSTSRGQAERVGRWIIDTSQLDTEMCTWSVGVEGTVAAPGQIVKVFDPDRAGARQAGRIRASTLNSITTDAAPIAGVGDSLTVTLPTGVTQTQTISQVTGVAPNLTLHVAANFSALPQVESVWAVESVSLQAKMFKILAVKDNTDATSVSYQLTAISHNPSKFANVDTGKPLTTPPISILPGTTLPAPASVTITSHTVLIQGTAQIVMTISCAKVVGATAYSFMWQKDNGSWVNAGVGLGNSTVDVVGVYPGNYIARAYATNANRVNSPVTLSAVTAVVGKTSLPPAPILTATPNYLEIDLSWTFASLVNLEDSSYTEIGISNIDDVSTVQSIGHFAYPINVASVQNLGVAETYYFWARLVDKSGNVGFWSNPSVACTTLTTDQFFEPILDIVDQTNLDVQALQDLIDNTIEPEVQSALSELFPPFAGSLADLAGNTATYVGNWSEVTKRQTDDQLSMQILNLLGVMTANKRAFILGADTVQIDATTTLAKRLTDLTAQSAGYAAQITAEAQARADGDSALASDITTVQASMDDINARVDTETQARVDADGALAQQITDLTATDGTVTAAIAAEATARANGDSANATAVNSLSTTVGQNTAAISTVTQSVNGVLAKYAIVLDVNGRVTGFQLIGGGGITSANFVVDKFSVASPNTVDALTWSNGLMVARAGGFMKVTGINFGTTGDLIEWYGPVMASSLCSKSNAVYYLDRAGDAYFGGSLSAGVLKNASTSSVVSNTATADTGIFGTNGGSKSIVGSVSWSNTGTINGNVVGTYNNMVLSSTITTSRSYNGGAFVQVGSGVVHGSVQATYDPEFGRTDIVAQINGSITSTDATAGTGNFEYKVVLSGGSGWPITTSLGNGGQRTSIISTES
jgi:predicted phage tail protein